jgi:hypothetical protein
MTTIKQRRLTELTLSSHPGLYVGQCVPFYFCHRSIMLYLIHRANHPELAYRGGQAPILHLEADLRRVAAWADQHGYRWAFTLSNAGSRYFEDRCDLTQLTEVDWDAVEARNWQQHKDGKQAEFLVEHHVPWSLVDRIAVLSRAAYQQAANVLAGEVHRPPIEIRPDWYY